MGRRHRAANYQAGMWQLAPAGSVDAGAVAADGTVDLLGQLLVELQEELGLPPGAVCEPRVLCIVEHPGSHVSDLGVALASRWDAAAILAAHRDGGNAEYERLAVVPKAELTVFLAATGGVLVPSAREFLIRAEQANRSGESSR